jgi:PKD repeat protein
VANQDPDSLTPINLTTHQPEAPITLVAGSLSYDIAVSPNGKTAYVTDDEGGVVTPIDTATGGAGTPIVVAGRDPLGIAITPDQAPVASFTATPEPAGMATTFNAAASTAAGAPITKYQWQFGDGVVTSTSGPGTSHVYASTGSYTVTLTVTDADGTSTKRVFTGQTVSRNGTPTARCAHTLTIPS